MPRFLWQDLEPGGFIQDDFKIRPNLILNLGVRYEYYSVFGDKEGFLLNAGNPSNAYANPPLLSSRGFVLRTRQEQFPATGWVCLEPGTSGKNVVRGGFGMTVAPFNLRNFYTLAAY